MLEIRFVVADDLIGDGGARVEIFEFDGGGKHDASIRIECGRVDDLRGGKLRFDFGDAAFDKTLLLFCRIVFGVLRQIALGTRFRDLIDNRGPFN